jgi:hypothetical protein
MLTTPKQVAGAERVLSAGTWAITAGAVLFSVLTVTPLMKAHTPAGWGWTAPILPLVVDSAVVIVVRLDSTLARLDARGGPWPVILRWLTGVFTLALNIGNSALSGDMVGVSVHLVAPALLIVTSEASLAYRRAIAGALARIEREQRERRVHDQAEQEAREQRERAERQAERDARERSERETAERAERLEREAREAAAAEKSAVREHEARMERERAERERSEREAHERGIREAREHEAAERERREREATERAEKEAREREEAARQESVRREREQAREHEQAEREHRERRQRWAALLAEFGKIPEDQAVFAVNEFLAEGRTVREIAELTGWSTGWVSTRRAELTTPTSRTPQLPPAAPRSLALVPAGSEQ